MPSGKVTPHYDPKMVLQFVHHPHDYDQWEAYDTLEIPVLCLRGESSDLLLAETADEAGLPSDPEFRSAFVAYIEWGSRIGLANSQPGAAPPPEAPVPRWGWGEAPPDL